MHSSRHPPTHPPTSPCPPTHFTIMQVWRGKDTSAAAIAASGLLRLSRLVPAADEARRRRYWDAGAGLVAALADGHLGWHQERPRLESLLANGTYHVPKGEGLGVGLIWGELVGSLWMCEVAC